MSAGVTLRVAILSPHRDDAAFSCGLTACALLRAGASVTVVNVFTRSDYAVDLSTVAAAMPLADAVSAARLREDRAFVADLETVAGVAAGAVRLRDLAWLDAPLRLHVATEQVLASPLSAEQVEAEVYGLAGKLAFLREYDVVFVPLALGDHIDHRIARNAAARVLLPERLCLYEDLPYAARMDATERKIASIHAVSSQPGQGLRQHALHLPQGAHLKRRFALHYPSQIAPAVADEMAAYADAEREGAEFWWSERETATRLRSVLECGDDAVQVIEVKA